MNNTMIRITFIIAFLIVGLPCFSQDSPVSIDLYHYKGRPGMANTAYPLWNLVYTGDTIPVCAKIFDITGVWLSKYEDSAHAGFFKWSVKEETPGTCFLTDTVGFETKIICKERYSPDNVLLLCTYSNVIHAKDSIILNIIHKSVARLSIEIASDKPKNYYEKLHDTISLNNHDTSLISTLRDEYGNLIKTCTTTVWKSLDTTIAKVQTNYSSDGRVLVTAGAMSGQTSIIATYDDSFFDTVTISNYLTYVSKKCNYYTSGVQYFLKVLPDNTIKILQTGNQYFENAAIYTLSGVLVYLEKGNGQKVQDISMKSVPCGMYILNLFIDHKNYRELIFLTK